MSTHKKHRISLVIAVLVILSLVIIKPVVMAQDTAQNSDNIEQEGSGSVNPSTEEALAAAIVPSHDRAEVAQRLQGIENVPPPPTTPLRTFALGDVDQFWVQGDDDVVEIDATLMYINDVVYMWVENGYSMEQSDLELAADTFANEIYQAVRDVFGSEALPGVDGDPRIHILHTDKLGIGIAGYFFSESQYSEVAVPTSNQREMFFISTTMLDYGVNYYLSVLSHEFQHMIHWATDANEESWMNEGLAELSAFVAGYGTSDFTTTYLENPSVQLNNWPDGNTRPIYGGGFLFTAYLLDRYGIDAIKSLVADPINGMDSIQVMLDEIGATDPITGVPMTTEMLFADFAIANYFNNTALLDGQYGYHHSELRGFRTRAETDMSLPVNLQNVALNQWGNQYYTVNNVSGQTLDVNFSGSSEVNLLPETAFSGEYAYWSNRVDSSDTRLTRAFDLSGVENATLTFQTWYDIEYGWDYAYVMVSPDDGESWILLETDRTTTDNPHGTAYGVGYTGESEAWIEQRIDLSAFAGQQILVRFEYVTDDATLEQGFLLDDVAIPEIGYFTDFEQPDDSWNVEGWALIDNVIQQHFALHVIEIVNDETIRVQRLMTGDNTQTGQWELSIGADVSELMVIVTPFASVTTQPATFNLSISSPTE